MPVDRDNIAEVIRCAWHAARRSDASGKGRGRVNEERSAVWVDFLAKQFCVRYKGCRYRTFWRKNCENKTQFLLNEMLFDIAVCSVGTTTSLKNKDGLEYIAQCHWQVESEFDRGNFREIVKDMSKLVMGLAENKLFIAAHRIVKKKEIDCQKEKAVLCRCAKIAERCDGNVYFCFVSHPDDWSKEDEPPKPKLFEWDNGIWKCISRP